MLGVTLYLNQLAVLDVQDHATANRMVSGRRPSACADQDLIALDCLVAFLHTLSPLFRFPSSVPRKSTQLL